MPELQEDRAAGSWWCPFVPRLGARRAGPARRGRLHRPLARLQPDHAPAHYNLSVLLTDLGKFDEALRELQTARRLLPDRSDIPFKLGVLLSNHGRYAEACANFAEALRLKPDFEQARQYLRFCEEKRRASESR